MYVICTKVFLSVICWVFAYFYQIVGLSRIAMFFPVTNKPLLNVTNFTSIHWDWGKVYVFGHSSPLNMLGAAHHRICGQPNKKVKEAPRNDGLTRRLVGVSLGVFGTRQLWNIPELAFFFLEISRELWYNIAHSVCAYFVLHTRN